MKTNNYRYYSERQLGDLLLIQELNRFGIPLKTIVALVQNQELFLLKSMLEENLQQMRRELEQKQLQYHQLVDALLRIQDGIMRLEAAKQPNGSGRTSAWWRCPNGR